MSYINKENSIVIKDVEKHLVAEYINNIRREIKDRVMEIDVTQELNVNLEIILNINGIAMNGTIFKYSKNKDLDPFTDFRGVTQEIINDESLFIMIRSKGVNKMIAKSSSNRNGKFNLMILKHNIEDSLSIIKNRQTELMEND